MDQQQLMQQVMSDPEIMNLLSQPGMMQKLQDVMADPSSAAQYMNDPDFMMLVNKIQGMQSGMGGMGMGNDMGMGMGGSGYGGQQESHGGVTVLQNGADFPGIISNEKKLPVVVDFTATWCGPCKAIAPVFAELAEEYGSRMIFLKVDGDQHRMLMQQKGVNSFPTFQFYVNGSMVEQFSGAQRDKLKSLVASYAAPLEEKTPSVKYVHFPLVSEEKVCFKKANYEAILAQLVKGSDAITDRSLNFTDGDVKELDRISKLLQNKLQYHMAKFSTEQIVLIDRLVLQWPVEHIAGVLNLLRMCVLHPHFAMVYSERKLVPRLCTITTQVTKATVGVLAVRTLANTFNRLVLAKQMVIHIDDVLEATSALMGNFPTESGLKLAVASLLINFAILFSENKTKYEDEKVQLLSSVLGHIQTESNSTDPKLMYRFLVVVGTLLYEDDSAIALAKMLDLEAVLSNLKVAGFAEDTNVPTIIKELEDVFARHTPIE